MKFDQKTYVAGRGGLMQVAILLLLSILLIGWKGVWHIGPGHSSREIVHLVSRGNVRAVRAVDRRLLVFLGDSHTLGVCTDPDCVPFTEVVARNLWWLYDVKALGFSGMPVWLMSLRSEPFDSEVAPHVVGASVSVMLARGDILYHEGGIPAPWFELMVDHLESRLLAAGATRVIFNTSPPSYYDPEGWQQERLAEYHEILTGEGRGPDNWLFLNEHHFPPCTGDCIHMNQEGHQLLGNAMSWFWLLRSELE